MIPAHGAPTLAPTVLVVDDDPATLEALTELLHTEGYRSLPFTDPFAALDCATHGRSFDLALLDCVMPGLTGPELLVRLRAAGFDGPALLLTALSDPAACGGPDAAVSVVNKPFDADLLLRDVARLLDQRRRAGRTAKRVEAGSRT
jgi:CheY-like chemotaxis protein